MFAVALMSTSCCKDDPIVPDGPLTESELVGTWVSTENPSDYVITIDMDNPNISNTNGEDWILIDIDLNGDKIEISGLNSVSASFNVVEYDRTAPATLTLDLTYRNDNGEDWMPLGTYVFVKY